MPGPHAVSVTPRSPDQAACEALIQAMQVLDARGLNRGSTGNGSVRAERGGFWITPTGSSAADLRPDRLVHVDEQGHASGPWLPSSEWHFHQAIYRARPDLQAVLHTHSVHATALACQRRRLPPFHYMVAIAGGDDVPCTPYHLFGTEALSQAVGEAFRQRQACLMAHHGLVAGGRDTAQAQKVLIEVEALCEIYLKALVLGEPAPLTPDQMSEVLERFRTYGQPRVP